MTAKILTSSVFTLVALSFSPLRAQTPSAPGTIAKEKFNLDKAGEEEVGYAQAVRVGSTIYVSGSVGEAKICGRNFGKRTKRSANPSRSMARPSKTW